MKIYNLVANENSLVLRDGFPITERYRKNKETGEKKFYPVGTYNLDKARSQYFFLGKSFHDLIKENNLDRIDYMIFREHNNIPGLKIAFPNKKDTSAFLVFDGYTRKQVTFVNDKEPSTLQCPYCNRPSANYEKGADDRYHCSYCKATGTVSEDEDQAAELAEEYHLDSSIKIQGLVNKFFHIDYGNVKIFQADTSVEVEAFLDTFAVTIPDGTTIRFLLDRVENGVATQYLVEFTHKFDNKPIINISCLNEKGFTMDQYYDLEQEAIDSENMLKHSISKGVDTIFFFPNKDLDPEPSPFSCLKDMVDKTEENSEDNQE